jgi:hypothetical protein
MASDQLSLFSVQEQHKLQRYRTSEDTILGAAALQAWTRKVYRFQREVRYATGPHQTLLFDAPQTQGTIDPYHLDPFSLRQQNIEFWRWQYDEAGAAALYFVVDYERPILLYVGETKKSNQRWKGVHDCKRYVTNYVMAHRHHGLPTTVNIGFMTGAPEARKARQQLESCLIERWRSPFNKENWTFWSTPFVSGD